MRRSISTNSPESARFDQSGLAVVCTSTIQPFSRCAAVTSGVPSVRRAQVLVPRSGAGSASTWRLTVTSGGSARWANGLASSNGAKVTGLVHDMAPPNERSPRLSLTGTRSSSLSARRGPAKRISMPPPSIQDARRLRSASVGTLLSGRMTTDSSRDRRSPTEPRRTSAKGESARSR